MSDLVNATWLPGFPVVTPHGELNPGDTLELSRGEAEASDHWQIVPDVKTTNSAAGGEE